MTFLSSLIMLKSINYLSHIQSQLYGYNSNYNYIIWFGIIVYDSKVRETQTKYLKNEKINKSNAKIKKNGISVS